MSKKNDMACSSCGQVHDARGPWKTGKHVVPHGTPSRTDRGKGKKS